MWTAISAYLPGGPAIVEGDVFIDQVSDETVKDAEILEVARRVFPVVDQEREVPVVGSVVMEVKTKDGRILSKETRFPRGNPGNPAGMDDCAAKFRKAAAHSRAPFPKRQLEEIVEVVQDLENLKNVRRLAKLLVPRRNGGQA